LRDCGQCDAEQIGDLGVSCVQHVFHANCGIAHIVGHLGATRMGQLPNGSGQQFDQGSQRR
jgi:hypothetical protein